MEDDAIRDRYVSIFEKHSGGGPISNPLDDLVGPDFGPPPMSATALEKSEKATKRTRKRRAESKDPLIAQNARSEQRIDDGLQHVEDLAAVAAGPQPNPAPKPPKAVKAPKSVSFAPGAAKAGDAASSALDDRRKLAEMRVVARLRRQIHLYQELPHCRMKITIPPQNATRQQLLEIKTSIEAELNSATGTTLGESVVLMGLQMYEGIAVNELHPWNRVVNPLGLRVNGLSKIIQSVEVRDQIMPLIKEAVIRYEIALDQPLYMRLGMSLLNIVLAVNDLNGGPSVAEAINDLAVSKADA